MALIPEKLLKKISQGSLNNVRFADMIKLVEVFGFELSRVSGSHHIYIHSDIPERINLQEVGGEAKPYQIRQFLRIVERNNLRFQSEDS